MLLTRAANLIYDSALSLLYPQACAVCGAIVSARRDGIACTDCWAKVRFLTQSDTTCWKCGELAVQPTMVLSEEQLLKVRCGRCDLHDFDIARACGAYELALRAAVIALKREPHLCQRLCARLHELQSRPPLNTATRIIPVPLHAARERVRGFNQAKVIGDQLARRTRLLLDSKSLIRTVHSERHRAGMDATARKASVANVFEVRYPRLIAGQSVLLVDDVFTTGATVSACARVLRDAGAEQVLVLTLARRFRS